METGEKTDRKTQISQVADRLFSEKGYVATSMRDIAEALEIEPASLYSHIKSKEELLWETASRCANEFFSAVKPIFRSELKTQIKLKEMVIAHVEIITRNLSASAIFFTEWKHLTEPRKSEYAQTRDEYEEMFRAVVRKGIEENLFRNDIFKNYDERFTARTILSALNWTHTWYRPQGELKPKEIGEKLAEILLNGIIRTI